MTLEDREKLAFECDVIADELLSKFREAVASRWADGR